MIRTKEEWYKWCMERGTFGDQVFHILNDWEEDVESILDTKCPHCHQPIDGTDPVDVTK